MKTLCYIFAFGMMVFALLYADSCSRLRDSTLTAQAIRSVWEADKAISEKESEVWESKVDSLETRQAKKDSIYHKRDSVFEVRIKQLTMRIRAINLSKSGEKELDSLINQLYGN